MTTIQYLDEVIVVPTAWDEIKLKHYENFYKDRPEKPRERVALVAKICDIEPAKLLNLPAEVFNIVVEQTGFIFENYVAEPSPKIEIDGTTYVIPIEEKLSLGAYIDADEAQKAGDNVLSNILAIVCRPVGEAYDDELTEQRAEMFGNVTMDKIWPLLAFFLRCKNALDNRTIAFTNLTRAVELLPPNILSSLRHGDGIKLSQMWQIIKYYFLIRSLRYRLRRLLRSYNLGEIKISQTQRKEN